jgi:type I restriction enzyme S subunit
MKLEKKKIKEFTTVITGGTPSTLVPGYWENGNIPWINSGELNQEFVTSCSKYITRQGLENSSSRLMPADTVLIALTGTTTGKTAYLTFEACANQSVTGILPSPYHNSKYLYYFLTSCRSKILNDAYGGAQKHISQQYVKEIEVPLPPLQIQEQIADTLDKADALRKKDQELLQKYDELSQAIFYDMFGDPEENPFEWGKVHLNEISDCITKGESPNWQGYEYQDSGVLFVTSENVGQGKIILEGKTKYIPLAFHEKLKRSQLNDGDVLINLVGASIGRCSVFYNDNQPANINQAVALIRCSKIRLIPEYLSFLLRTDYMQRVIKGGIVEFARANISLSDINNFAIILPPLKLQSIFLKRIQTCRSMVSMSSKTPELFEVLMNISFP